MKHSSDLVLNAEASIVVAAVSDLSTYPHWNDLVSSATPTPPASGDPGPAWLTTLKAHVGPFSRSKQLRFVRIDADDLASDEHQAEDATQRIRFVRREVDGRTHASWAMDIEVVPNGSDSRATLTLSYDGSLWIPALGTVLGGAIDRATERLPAYLDARNP